MSFLVAQRTREIGVRMALGATHGRIMRRTLASAGLWTASGVVIGAAGSLAVARLFRSLLFQVDPSDPVAMAGAVVVLCVVSLMTAVARARRASRIDPVKSLHQM